MEQQTIAQTEDDNPSQLSQNRGSARRKLSVNKRKSGASTSLPALIVDERQHNQMEKHHRLMEDNLKRAKETALREKNNQEREEQEQRDILERHKKEQKDAYEKYLLAINRKNEENYLRSMPTIQNIYNKVNVIQKENKNQDPETAAADMQNLKESNRQQMSRPAPLNNEEKYLREQQIEKELYENQLMQIQLLKKKQVLGGGNLKTKEGGKLRNNAQVELGGQIHETDTGDFNQVDEEKVPRENKDQRKSQQGDYYNLGQVRNVQKPFQTPILPPGNKSIFTSKSNFAQKKVENGRYSTSNEPPYYPSKGYPYSSSQANLNLKQQQQSQQPQSFLPPLSNQFTNQHKQVALSKQFQKIKLDRSESARTSNSKLDGKLKPSTSSKLQQIHLDNKELVELKFKQEQLVIEKAEFKRLEALNNKSLSAFIRENPQLSSQDRLNDGLLALNTKDQEELSDTELDEASELQYGETDNKNNKKRDFKGQSDGEYGQIGRPNNKFGDISKVSGKSFFVGQHNSTHTSSLLYAQNMKERRKFWEEKSTQEEFRSQPIEEKSRITAIQKFRSKLLNNQKAAANQEDQNQEQQQNLLKPEKKKSEAQIWKSLNQQEVALQREILSIHFENYEKVKQIEDKNNISLANAVNTSEILKSRAGSALSSVTTKTNKTSKTIKSKGSSIIGQENAKGNRNLKQINPISEIENEDDLQGSLLQLEEQLNSKRTKITELQEAQAEQSKPKNLQAQRILLTIPAILQQNPFLVDLTNPDKEQLEKEKGKIQEEKQQNQQKSSPRIREKDTQGKKMVSRESIQKPKSLAKEVIEQQQQPQIISSREKKLKEVKQIIGSTNRGSSGSLLSNAKHASAFPGKHEQEIIETNKISKNNRATPEITKPNIIMFQNQINSSKEVDISSSPIRTDKIQMNSSDQSVKTQDQKLQKEDEELSFAKEKENQAGNSNNSQELNQKQLKLIKANGQTKNKEVNPQIIANDKEDLTKWWKSIQQQLPNEGTTLVNVQVKEQQSPELNMKPSSPNQEGNVTKKQILTANSQIKEDEEKKVIDRKQQIKEEFMRQLNQSETDELGYQESSYLNSAEEQDSLKKGKDLLNQLKKESQENKDQRNTQQLKEITKENTESNQATLQIRESYQNDHFVESNHLNNQVISQISASRSPEPKKTLADILDKNIIARVEYSQAQIEQTIGHIEQRIETLEKQEIKAVLESKKQRQLSQTNINNPQDKNNNIQSEYQLSEISHNGSFTESEFSVISGVGSYTVKSIIKKEYQITGKVPSRYPHPDPSRNNNSFISHNSNNSFSRLQVKDNNDFQMIGEKQVILEEEDQGDIKINKNVNLQKLLFVD